MDNQAPEVTDNAEAQSTEAAETTVGTGESAKPITNSFTWKDKLGADLLNSPVVQKFDDSPEGLKKAIESHASLEKLLGHDKVPIPKNADDVEGWNRFSKAMGIPDKAEGYGLADPALPGEMSNLTFNKNQFAEIVHAFKLTPNQAQGLWKAYTEMSAEAYSKYKAQYEDNLKTVVNQLRSEWGDTYDTNIELGQMVINKFAGDKETEDYITSTLSKDPRGIKFLAKLGNQFAENQVGEFKNARFSLAPEQAKDEIDKILKDPKHPYLNDRATPRERDAAVDYVNSLYRIINKGKQ